MTEHARIGERTFPYLAPADRPTLRKQPIGYTEAVFESGEVGITPSLPPRKKRSVKVWLANALVSLTEKSKFRFVRYDSHS